MMKVNQKLVVFILIGLYSLYGFTQSNMSTRERFKEIYKRIYMQYYAQKKYEDALSVLLRVKSNKLDDSSRVDLNLLLGRIYVDLGKTNNAEEYFLKVLQIRGNYIPPAGEWLPEEEECFFTVKKRFKNQQQLILLNKHKSIFTKISEKLRKNVFKIALGAGGVIGAAILLSNGKEKKKTEVLPEPPGFPTMK